MACRGYINMYLKFPQVSSSDSRLMDSSKCLNLSWSRWTKRDSGVAYSKTNTSNEHGNRNTGISQDLECICIQFHAWILCVKC